MLKKRWLIQASIFVLAIIIFLPNSTASAFIGDDDWEYAQASCFLVDHNWLTGDYPNLDASSPIYFGSLSLGGFGLTFDIDYVQPDSVWTVNFNNEFELETTVDEYGRAMIYYGLWSYGNYEYTSTLVFPNSTEVMDGPFGTIVINESEFLDCALSFLPNYFSNATETPEPLPSTPNPNDVEEPVLVVDDISPPDLFDSEVTVGETFVSKSTSLWYLFCACVILLILIIIGILILVRRRKRQALEN